VTGKKKKKKAQKVSCMYLKGNEEVMKGGKVPKLGKIPRGIVTKTNKVKRTRKS